MVGVRIKEVLGLEGVRIKSSAVVALIERMRSFSEIHIIVLIQRLCRIVAITEKLYNMTAANFAMWMYNTL